MEKSSDLLSSEALKQEINLLQRRLVRERRARKEAEKLLETKSLELFEVNQNLKSLNSELGERIEHRTQTLNALIENLHAGLLLNDANGKIVLVNEEFRRVFKFNISKELVLGEDQRESAELVKHLFKNPEQFTDTIDHCLNNNSSVHHQEMIMNDGTILDCDFIPIHAANKFIGQLWQVNDVTAIRTAQKSIRISEEKYRGIIENMELGLLEVDQSHRIQRAYQSFCDMVGYEEADLIGKDAREVFLVEDYHSELNRQDELRMAGKQSIYEVQMRRRNGEVIWVLISGAPLYDQNGQINGSIGIHYDITHRKKLEEDLKEAKLQADDARKAEQQFLANMSHEIRNPLNAIIGITNLLYDTDPSDDQLKYLNNIKYASDILKGLISSILDISKIESGKLELIEEEIDIADVVNGLIQIGVFHQHGQDVNYINRLEGAKNLRVIADPTVINQIFLNLLGNASKFTSNGHIIIGGEIIGEKGKKLNIEFSVTDSGIGIPPDRIDAIFESFKQADYDTKIKYGGTGLGLSIVKILVQRYGGKISVDSKIGKGSKFTFNLWLKKAPEFRTRRLKMKFAGKDKCRILIVEDNVINQQYLEGILDRWGIDHDKSNDGVEALEMLSNNDYDLILMDIRMPNMDGYDTTIRLRSDSANINHLKPIIALTASALVDEKEKALQAGMNFHLTKPFTPSELGEALASFGLMTKLAQQDEPSFVFSKQLDQSYLNLLYQNDLERAKLMFEIFLKVIGEEFAKFEELLKNEKWEEVGALAHKLKSNFQMVGLSDIAQELIRIEAIREEPELISELNELFEDLSPKVIEGRLLIKHELIRLSDYIKA
ncbi:MAG: PAS domain S-box protein [Cyclobacteriaceae bacterium]